MNTDGPFATPHAAPDEVELALMAMLSSDALSAPGMDGDRAREVAAHARRRDRLRQRTRVGLGFAAAVVCAAIVGMAVLFHEPLGGSGVPAAIESDPETSLGEEVSGPVVGLDTVGTACKIYTPVNVMTIGGFAFDGTVTDIGGPLMIEDPDGGSMPVVAATFDVHQWFTGRPERDNGTALVHVPVGGSIDPGPPPIAVDDRLLVSGSTGGPDSVIEGRWIAFGCGFTRHYDPATAQEWQQAAR